MTSLTSLGVDSGGGGMIGVVFIVVEENSQHRFRFHQTLVDSLLYSYPSELPSHTLCLQTPSLPYKRQQAGRYTISPLAHFFATDWSA